MSIPLRHGTGRRFGVSKRTSRFSSTARTNPDLIVTSSAGSHLQLRLRVYRDAYGVPKSLADLKTTGSSSSMACKLDETGYVQFSA